MKAKMDVNTEMDVTLHEGTVRRIEVDATIQWGHAGYFDPYDGGVPPEPDEVDVRRVAWTDTSEVVAYADLLKLIAGPEGGEDAEDAAHDRIAEQVIAHGDEVLGNMAEDAAGR